jgi:hypothetical protein
MGEVNSLEILLNQFREQRRREALGLTGLESFSPVQGALPIDTSLELAVLTLAHYRYRGIPQWRVQQTYSFTCNGIFLRTYVEAWQPGLIPAMPVRFTPEEAILIARQVSQQDGDW